MATIGTFTNDDGVLGGEIITLSVQARNVRIVPETGKLAEGAPSHRVYVDRAWRKQSGEGRDYLAVKLDDPSFAAPVYANLFANDDATAFNLIWSRPSKRRG